MAQSIKQSFTANSETEETLINILLSIAGFTRASFIAYMDTTAEIMATNPTWAKKYLEDVIDANLTHLGYVMKDTKTSGIMGEYKEQFGIFETLQQEVDGIQNPIMINEDVIVREDGTLKVSYIANAERVLRAFNNSHSA
jgi:hypothetical protein